MYHLIGTRFDLEAKKLRFVAVLAMYVASFIEIFTLCMPFYFLVFASLANLIKNIAWIILSATRASQLVQMSRSGNLGDLTAKMGSQGTASSLIGTTLGVGLSTLLALNDFYSFLLAFLPLSVIGISSLYMSTSYMVTNTLNRERLNIILDYFWIRFSDEMAGREDPWHTICEAGCEVADSFILTPDEVSVEESFISPIVRWNYLPHVNMNPSLSNPSHYDIFLEALASTSPDTKYILHVVPDKLHYKKPVYLWMLDGSTARDHIEAYFKCYILEKFHFDEEKLKGLHGLYHAWQQVMASRGWNLEKFYYPDMERRMVKLKPV
jgi:hypothetical protein